MKHVLLGMILFIAHLTFAQCVPNISITSVDIIAPGTVLVSINGETQPGEAIVAQIRYNIGAGDQFTGFIDGTFVAFNNPDSDWEVEISGLPEQMSLDINIETAACCDDSDCANNLEGFSGFNNPFTINTLPVDFLSINTTNLNNEINLTFTTATETNNAYFNIERSTDSRNWKKLGSIAGAGTTQQEQQYSFLDEAPLPGLNYYRIKQVDYDGSFSYSPIVSARWEGKAQVYLFPNPTNDLLQISGLPTTDGPITIEIIDMAGRIMLRHTWNQSAINVASLADGVYSLRISSSIEVIDSQRLFIH